MGTASFANPVHATRHSSAGDDPVTPDSIGAATAAQGAKADTAVQPGSLATVATTGAYNDLSGKPTLGTAAAANTTAFDAAGAAAAAITTAQTNGDARYNRQLPQIIYMPDLDYTGATDATAAIVAVQTTYASVPYRIVLGAGSLKLGTSGDLNTFGRGQGIVGPGSGLLQLNYNGSATCIAVKDSSFSSASSIAGTFSGFTINGSPAANGAVGMSWGDMLRGVVDDVTINNFHGTGSIALLMKNSIAGTTWSEEGRWHMRFVFNTNTVVFDSGSFDYCDFDFYVNFNANQNGIVLQNGAQLNHCTVRVKGNCSSAATNTGIFFSMDKTGTGSSQFKENYLSMQAECGGSTGLGPQSIFMASTSTFSATGVIAFSDGSTGFQAATIPTNGVFGFSGRLKETSLAYANTGEAHFVWGGSQWNEQTVIAGFVYLDRSKYWAMTLPSGATNFTLNDVGTHSVRELDLLLQQPASGAAGTINWPAGIKWAGGTHALSGTNGAVDRVHLRYSPTLAGWFGEVTLAYA